MWQKNKHYVEKIRQTVQNNNSTGQQEHGVHKNIGRMTGQYTDNVTQKAVGQNIHLQNTAAIQEEITKTDLQTQWKIIGVELNKNLGDDVYSSWFGRFSVESFDGHTLMCSVPTPFLRHWIKTNYTQELCNVWQKHLPKLVHIDIRVRKRGESFDTQQNGSIHNSNLTHDKAVVGVNENSASHFTNANLDHRSDFTVQLDKRMNFDNFVVSPSNKIAYEAALSVSDQDVQLTPKYNPLYIHASVGLGKTHLLHALVWRARNHIPASRIAYITAERFMYHFVSAIRSNEGLKFKGFFNNIDLFLVDDMQFLQGKNTKQEFCHIINTLIDRGKQIVVVSDVPPKKLEGLDERVRSRLGGGLVVEIDSTDFDLRLAILQSKLRLCADENKRNMVPDSILQLIARKLEGNGRDLEGALMRILASVNFTGRVVTKELVEYSLRDMMHSNLDKRILIEDIMQYVCKHYSVEKEDLHSSRRSRNIVRPRQIGMYLSKFLTSRSLPEIGRAFGGRDHTTVLHAVRRVEELIKQDEQIKEDVNLLSNLIRYNHG